MKHCSEDGPDDVEESGFGKHVDARLFCPGTREIDGSSIHSCNPSLDLTDSSQYNTQ